MKKKFLSLLYFPAILIGDLNANSEEENCSTSSVSKDLVEYETIVNPDSIYNVYEVKPTIFTWRAPGMYFWKYAIRFRVGDISLQPLEY
ncbi:MAG: hypothetical protein H0U49_03355 [Parachlamydiaceae bacterium]|nr:hypothetical protein [Parachlamydiaceae bacterium]